MIQIEKNSVKFSVKELFKTANSANTQNHLYITMATSMLNLQIMNAVMDLFA